MVNILEIPNDKSNAPIGKIEERRQFEIVKHNDELIERIDGLKSKMACLNMELREYKKSLESNPEKKLVTMLSKNLEDFQDSMERYYERYWSVSRQSLPLLKDGDELIIGDRRLGRIPRYKLTIHKTDHAGYFDCKNVTSLKSGKEVRNGIKTFWCSDILRIISINGVGREDVVDRNLLNVEFK